MPHAIPDPFSVLWNRQTSCGVAMYSQGAVEWHQAIPDQSITQHAALFCADSGRRVAVNFRGKWHEVLPGRDRAVAQVGDTCATCPTQMRERRHVRTQTHHRVEPVAAALQRRALMRRAKKYELAKILGPPVSCRMAVMTGASGNKPAHAVSHDCQFLDRRRAIV